MLWNCGCVSCLPPPIVAMTGPRTLTEMSDDDDDNGRDDVDDDDDDDDGGSIGSSGGDCAMISGLRD